MAVNFRTKFYTRIFTWLLFALVTVWLFSVRDTSVLLGQAAVPFFILVMVLASFAYELGGMIAFMLLSCLSLILALGTAPGVLAESLILFAGLSSTLCFLLHSFKKQIQSKIDELEYKTAEHEESQNLLSIAYKKNLSIKESFLKKMDRYRKFRNTAESLASTLSIQELCERIIQSAEQIVDKGDCYTLYLLQNNKMELKHYKTTDEFDIESYKQNDDFINWSLHNKQPLCVSDTGNDFRFVSGTNSDQKAKSLIIHPLVNNGETVGFLRIDSAKSEHLNLEDLRVLSVISHLFSLLLQTVGLFHQTIELAIKDSLTGLYVRRYFDEELDKLFEKSQKDKLHFCVLLMDMDYLKKCNDEMGHMVGDIVLQNTAKQILKHCPKGCIPARFGGEEFALIMPNTTKTHAATVAEKIRAGIADSKIMIRRKAVKTSISIGLAQYPQDGVEREILLKRADMALYQAKQEGRNRVVTC